MRVGRFGCYESPPPPQTKLSGDAPGIGSAFDSWLAARLGSKLSSLLFSELSSGLGSGSNRARNSDRLLGNLLQAGSTRDSAWLPARLASRPGSGSVSGTVLSGAGLPRLGSMRVSARYSTRHG